LSRRADKLPIESKSRINAVISIHHPVRDEILNRYRPKTLRASGAGTLHGTALEIAARKNRLFTASSTSLAHLLVYFSGCRRECQLRWLLSEGLSSLCTVRVVTGWAVGSYTKNGAGDGGFNKLAWLEPARKKSPAICVTESRFQSLNQKIKCGHKSTGRFYWSLLRYFIYSPANGLMARKNPNLAFSRGILAGQDLEQGWCMIV
jgi:hypothetical protein